MGLYGFLLWEWALHWTPGYAGGWAWFNPVFPTMPPGTLAANLLGGYLIGIAMALFTEHAGLPPEVRLLVVTGFLGGLTTFSTFSAEAMTLISRGEYLWATLHIGAHLSGSLVMTMLGIATFKALKV